ncbi:prepilin-type N-terminal cleavage/methylation domain-containing protein [Flavimobilis sp. GY10621]|uniref:Prepilin-type N-terminal cleavage/methylation domain-containing protein n=1 Tax=Flavimobilis rhizosphaerae TaxID=2775421 RepID=A0ABR9DTW6_9MICO|nr:prepilin-type N-terminal cleavage/methylation domain-containing protein [Flavimobilis rhizosphaerae]MBD9700374.1 prepilin-type N-terminal cleavage/methylation domain-containing protein [Flavimobilis rhizosphaerae]
MTAMIQRLRARHVRSGDAGLTLVELLVYMLLLGIVMTIILTMTVTTLRKQTEVTRISQANDTAQNIVNEVDLLVSNASAFTVRSIGSDIVVLSQTRSTQDGAAEFGVTRCAALYYTADTRQVYVSRRFADPAGANQTPKPLTSRPTFGPGWTRLAEGVSPGDGSSAVFALKNVAGVTDATKLVTSLAIDTTTGKPPVTLTTTTGTRGLGVATEGRCW